MQEIPDVENIEKHLIVLQERKDRVMEASRDVVRMSGKAITLMHAQKLAEAGAGMKKLKLRVEGLKRLEKGFEYNSMQAHQEYVEALAFYVVLKEHRLVSLRETRVAEIAYLLGIMDLVGELKREAVDAIRERRIEAADDVLRVHEEHIRLHQGDEVRQRARSRLQEEAGHRQDTDRGRGNRARRIRHPER